MIKKKILLPWIFLVLLTICAYLLVFEDIKQIRNILWVHQIIMFLVSCVTLLGMFLMAIDDTKNKEGREKIIEERDTFTSIKACLLAALPFVAMLTWGGYLGLVAIHVASTIMNIISRELINQLKNDKEDETV